MIEGQEGTAGLLASQIAWALRPAEALACYPVEGIIFSSYCSLHKTQQFSDGA